MIAGVITAERPPIKLNTPPVKPIRRLGASDATSDQVIDANPVAKKAIDINTTTIVVDWKNSAPIMVLVKSRPVIIGVFRAVANE